jgi:hypothetical protein
MYRACVRYEFLMWFAFLLICFHPIVRYRERIYRPFLLEFLDHQLF